jgi:hypothetical protein
VSPHFIRFREISVRAARSERVDARKTASRENLEEVGIGLYWSFDILLALKSARIPTDPDFGPVSSVGSSHNRPTSAEDNEEALLWAISGPRSMFQNAEKL